MIVYLRVSSLRLSMKLMSVTITSEPRSPSGPRTGSRATCTDPFGSLTIEPTTPSSDDERRSSGVAGAADRRRHVGASIRHPARTVAERDRVQTLVLRDAVQQRRDAGVRLLRHQLDELIDERRGGALRARSRDRARTSGRSTRRPAGRRCRRAARGCAIRGIRNRNDSRMSPDLHERSVERRRCASASRIRAPRRDGTGADSRRAPRPEGYD